MGTGESKQYLRGWQTTAGPPGDPTLPFTNELAFGRYLPPSAGAFVMCFVGRPSPEELRITPREMIERVAKEADFRGE